MEQGKEEKDERREWGGGGREEEGMEALAPSPRCLRGRRCSEPKAAISVHGEEPQLPGDTVQLEGRIAESGLEAKGVGPGFLGYSGLVAVLFFPESGIRGPLGLGLHTSLVL